jgi:hypothetical protein
MRLADGVVEKRDWTNGRAPAAAATSRRRPWHTGPVTRDRPRVVLVCTLVLALALVCLAPAAGQARVPAGFAGIALADPVFPPGKPTIDLSKQLDAMVASGVESLRVVFNWSYAQPYKSWQDVPAAQMSDFTDAGGIPTRFDQMDEIVGLAAQRGLKLVPTVVYAPAWDSARHPKNTYARPSSDAPYANFLTALVDRYGPGGTFWQGQSPVMPIRMWQIWNEPNINVFWPVQPFEPTYMPLLKAAHDAIKRADPGAKIVLGGMPNYSWLNLQHIYKYRNARSLFDVVAIHPYTKLPQGVISIIGKVRTVMNQAGDRSKPILADELSWPSSLGKTTRSEFDFATTEAGQAQNIAQILPMLARDRARYNLLGFDYFTWAAVETRGSVAFNFSGLLRISGGRFTAKPAYNSFRNAVLAMESCRRKGSVATTCVQPR